MSGPSVVARSLYRFYRAGDDETQALRGVDLSVEPGELVVIAGPSGSGKSTLLACLAGLDDPDGGSVDIAGHRISHRRDGERCMLRARHCGLLFQSANLIEHLSVEANVSLAQSLVPAHRGGAARSVRRAELMASLGIEHRAAARPGTLSGGEAARAGLAVALANDPEVLLADEPTGEVDAATESQLIGLLRARVENGTTVVVVSHSTAMAAAADRVVTLQDGSVVDVG